MSGVVLPIEVSRGVDVMVAEVTLATAGGAPTLWRRRVPRALCESNASSLLDTVTMRSSASSMNVSTRPATRSCG